MQVGAAPIPNDQTHSLKAGSKAEIRAVVLRTSAGPIFGNMPPVGTPGKRATVPDLHALERSKSAEDLAIGHIEKWHFL
jgi:hypothetical protein